MLNPLKRFKPARRKKVKYEKKDVPLYAQSRKSNQTFINETQAHLHSSCGFTPCFLQQCTCPTGMDVAAVPGLRRRTQHPAPEKPHQPTGCTGAVEAISGCTIPLALRIRQSERGLSAIPRVHDCRAERHGHQHQQQDGERFIRSQCQLDRLERRHQPQEY